MARTTVILDDDLMKEAIKVTKIVGKTALLHEGLRALISKAAAQRLGKLGGTEKKLKPIPRKRLL
jgi:Arc/MetJ family transcription regulator